MRRVADDGGCGEEKAENAGWFGTSCASLRRWMRIEARRELADMAEAAKEESLPRLAELLSGKSAATDFLGAVFDLSPFMRDCARRQPAMLDRLFDASIEERLTEIRQAVKGCSAAPDVSEAGLMKDLRLLKTEAHFLIALSDLAGEVRNRNDGPAAVATWPTLASEPLWISCCATRTARGKLDAARPESPGRRLRLDRARHGQAWRARTQFLL